MRKSHVNRNVPATPEDASPSDKPLLVLHGMISTPPMSSQTRIKVGFHLRQIQQGEMLSMPLSRPLPIIGANCHELRMGDAERNVDWRIVYCIDEAAIVVLEVFKKETRVLPEHVIDACRERLNRYLAARKGPEEKGL